MMYKLLYLASSQVLLFIFNSIENRFISFNKDIEHNFNKGLFIKGGEFTKSSINNSNTTQIEVEDKTGNIENVFDINTLNRAFPKPKEKIISGNKDGRILKDQPKSLKIKSIDSPVLKPEKIEAPVLKPKAINIPAEKPARIDLIPANAPTSIPRKVEKPIFNLEVFDKSGLKEKSINSSSLKHKPMDTPGLKQKIINSSDVKEKLMDSTDLKTEIVDKTISNPEKVDVAPNLEPTMIDKHIEKPARIELVPLNSPVVMPTRTEKPIFNLDVFDKPRLKPDTSGNIKSDNNLDYIDKMFINKEYLNEYKQRIEKNFLDREIARKEFLRKRYDKLKIKKFVKNNLEPQNRVKFIPLPLSNKEIFDLFVLKNKFIIQLTSHFFNLSILYFYLRFFKADIIKYYKLIDIDYKNKQFKNSTEPIAKLLTIIILFISILCFGSRLIKFIGLNLSYGIFIFYKFFTL